LKKRKESSIIEIYANAVEITPIKPPQPSKGSTLKYTVNRNRTHYAAYVKNQKRRSYLTIVTKQINSGDGSAGPAIVPYPNLETMSKDYFELYITYKHLKINYNLNSI
jgi:hypothetical protein